MMLSLSFPRSAWKRRHGCSGILFRIARSMPDAFPRRALIFIHKYLRDAQNPSFRHGLPESSHREVKVKVGTVLRIRTKKTGQLPSMALDTRFPAGMTAFTYRSHSLRGNDKEHEVKE